MTYRDTASMRLLASLPSPLASPEDCAIARVDVERIVGRLPERERAVVEARMLGERGRTLRETAAMFDRSCEWARMVEALALRRMVGEVVPRGSEVRRRVRLVREVRG